MIWEIDNSPIVNLVKVYNDAIIPRYQTEGSAGCDLHAYTESPIIIQPGDTAIIGTGIAFTSPSRCFGAIVPRSGLAAKNGISILNSPGTIDRDFTAEVKVILINHGKQPFTVNMGDRIAQLVFIPYKQVYFKPVKSLEKTERGAGGFGSTGV